MRLHVLLGICSCAALLAANCSADTWHDADFQPRIEVEYEVFLSSGMKTALEKYAPGFQIWKAPDFHPMLRGMYVYKSSRPDRAFLAGQALSAVIGDFNGDGLPDAALMGRTKTDEALLVVLSKGVRYEVVEIYKYPYKGGEAAGARESFLENIAPRKFKPNVEDKPLNLKHDGFIHGVFEKASSLYYYSNGKFLQYALTD